MIPPIGSGVTGSIHSGAAEPSRHAGAPDRSASGKLAQAAQDLESVFVHHFVQALRKTVPDGGSPGAPGADLYVSLFDEHLAATISSATRSGIAEAIHRQLIPARESAHGPENE